MEHLMNIPGLGTLLQDDDNDWLISQPVAIAALDGIECELLIEAYVGDSKTEDFHDAIENFIHLSKTSLAAAEPAIFAYYQDVAQLRRAEKQDVTEIATPADVWQHIHFGTEALIVRRSTGDQAVYVSLECDCDWEEERGLQLVFKYGKQISKVGPFDDFLSNADVYGLAELDQVIYQSPG